MNTLGAHSEFVLREYLTRNGLTKEEKAARKFVEAIAKTVEWGRTTPRAEVIARLERIMARRKRNENNVMLKHWKPAAKHTPGGLLTDADFGIWIDWLVKDGQLKPGQVKPGDVYTNAFNPFAR